MAASPAQPSVRTALVGAACSILAIVGMASPWVYSGNVSRSSFQLLGLIDRLGFAPDGPARPAIQWWPLAPLLFSVAVLALFWHRSRFGAVLGLIAGSYVALFAGAIRFAAPDALRLGFGPVLTLVAGLAMVVTCVWSLRRR